MTAKRPKRHKANPYTRKLDINSPVAVMLLQELATADKELCEAVDELLVRQAKFKLHEKQVEILREAVEKLKALEVVQS